MSMLLIKISGHCTDYHKHFFFFFFFWLHWVFVVVHGLLIVVASLASEHGL